MTNFLTEETPEKVLGMLGVALTSMFFLFAVTSTNANFQGVENPFPDPFAPAKVVALIDNTASVYTAFLDQNLINPASAQFAFVADNVGFVADNAGPKIMQLAGLQNLGHSSLAFSSQPKVAHSTSLRTTISEAGRVAGVSTAVASSQSYQSSSGGFNIDSLYSIFIR